MLMVDDQGAKNGKGAPNWREELAWAAGFFDGEGCTYTKVGNPKTKASSIGIKVSQIHLAPLERFQRAVLGIGKLYGPYNSPSRAVTNASPIFKFEITGLEGCQAVMAMLWPFLCQVKKDQYLYRKSLVKCGYPYSKRSACGAGHRYVQGSFVVRDDGNGRRCLICQQEFDRRKRVRRREERTNGNDGG